MSIFKFKKWNSGKLVLVVLVFWLLIFGLRNFALAAPTSTTERTPQQEGCLSAGLSENCTLTEEDLKSASALMVSGNQTASNILTLIAGLVTFALDLGNQVISLPIVQLGSQIVLGFANLGFVLAIIVMAFATIFRVQSYAMKQTLWKLIVAALLVNFSLVIAGAVISVSNSFTNLFMSKISSGNNLPDALINLANPGAFLKLPSTTGGFLTTVFRGIGFFLSFISALVFILIFTFIIILTFFVLFIMFLIRAVYLGILLILMPIVWLLWIFPATKKHWQKWWTEFIRWNFFAPAVLFFIYLVVAMGTGEGAAKMQQIEQDAASKNANVAQALATGLASTPPDFFQQAIHLIIVTGLLLGGIFAANSLGITFASTAYGWAQDAGKGVGKWVGRETLEQTGGRVFGSKLMKGDAATGQKGLVERLSASRIPGVRFMGRGLNRLGLKTEETLQAGYAKLAKRMTPDEKNYEALNSRGTRRAAILQQTAKDRDIDMKKLSPLIDNPVEMKAIERNFGIAGLDFKDFIKATGRTPEMVQSSADIEKAKRENNTEALVTAEKNLKEATDRLVKSIPLKDYSKGQWNDIFEKSINKQTQSIQKALSTAFAEHENGAYSKITPQIKGKNMDTYIKIMNEGITEVGKNPELADKALKADEKFRKTLGRRAEFGEEAWTSWTPGAGAGTT